MKIDYNQADAAISELDSSESTSSAHGLLCGLLCGEKTAYYAHWIDEILLNSSQDLSDHKTLKALFAQTQTELEEGQFSITVLIDDNADTNTQAQQLAQWSSGFLVGLGLANSQTQDKDALEAIRDIANFARFSDALTDDEDDQNDFYTVFEHIKVATLLVYQDSKNNS